DSINIIVDKLITLLIEIQEEGNTFYETRCFIHQCISLSNQTPNNIFEWLLKNQTSSQYIFFLGFFYYHKFTLEENNDEAFKIFIKLSAKDYLKAQIKLASCYFNGIGTEVNKTKAFELTKIAAEKENSIAQHNLGFLFKFGEGVERDENKAFEYYKKSAENGY